jgi:deoxyadenosine/deoxycytidine kinase
MAQVIVAVLGGVGLGKSEFIRSMKRRINNSRIPALLESTCSLKVYEESRKVKNIATKKFYPAYQKGDRQQCFEAEAEMLRARFAYMQRAAKEDGIVIIERIPEENRYVFFQSAFDSHFYGSPTSEYSRALYNYYASIYERLRNGVPTPDVFVYLRANPEVAYRRVLSRGRESELQTDPHYFKMLHHYYEKLVDEVLPSIIRISNVPFADKLVPVDVNKDMTKSELLDYHIQVENLIIQALRRQGFGKDVNHV